ncbi:MAG: hypothetical protein H6686_09505 [Fibrobacteria bacterium]|nr:hypothetical protein [Fibrobacteria bacterium]
MPPILPPSSSWKLPRFTPEEMEAALSSFEPVELRDLSSAHLPLYELPQDAAEDLETPDLSDSRPDEN